MSHADTIQANAILDFLSSHARHVTQMAVAHTPHHTFGTTDAQIQRLITQAQKDCRHFRLCLNNVLYGNKARRKPLLCQPLLLPTLEGALVRNDRRLTLHYNFAIGNLPEGLSNSEFQDAFRECWVNKAGQSSNIRHEDLRGIEDVRGWIGYSMKEAQKYGNTLVWDVENTQIPYAAFNAD